MAEEDRPAVAEPLVEVDVALGRFGLEVGGGGAETEAWSVSCNDQYMLSCYWWFKRVLLGGSGEVSTEDW